jgi:hypothetical protein
MPVEYEIVETFEITGRGAVVVIDQVSERGVGKPHQVDVLMPGGGVIRTEAYKEWLLRRQPVPIEKEAYMLNGWHKNDIPLGSRLRFAE